MHTLRTVSLLVVVVACVKATKPRPCPGYTAKNVKKTASTLTADLTLAGEACNIYGADIPELRLEVGYDDGMFPTFGERDGLGAPADHGRLHNPIKILGSMSKFWIRRTNDTRFLRIFSHVRQAAGHNPLDPIFALTFRNHHSLSKL